MLDFAIHANLHLSPITLNQFDTSAPKTILSLLQDEIVATTQSDRVRDLQDQVTSDLATSDPTTNISRIEELYQKRDSLASKRSQIVHLPFLWLRFRKRKELLVLEDQLDRIEMEILKLQKDQVETISDVRLFITDIQERLENCAQSRKGH